MSYTVRSGDTLTGIAARYNLSLAQLERANPQIGNPNLIYVGEHINIPGSKDSFDHSPPKHHAPTHPPQQHPTPKGAKHPGPVQQLRQDLGKLRQAEAAGRKATHQEKVDVTDGKTAQAQIAQQKQAILAQLTDAKNPPDAATRAKLLQELVTLGQKSARQQDRTDKAVATDKQQIAKSAHEAKGDKARALKDLKPAEYKLNLADTNKVRKELGLKSVTKVIRPPEPKGPKGFKPLTPAQFRSIAPNLGDKAKVWTKYLNEAMIKYHITTPKREAAFIAQITEETDGMNTLVEYASGAEYNNRPDLGNTHPGDGPRFKGRGAIQLTGRFNYIKYGKEMGIDLVDHPQRAADPKIAFLIAGQYWVDHGLNHLADQGDFIGITERINGGTHGLSSREAYWAKAKRVLGIG